MVPSLKRLPSLPASCPSAHFLYSGCHARWWRHTGKQAMVSAPSLSSEIHENSAGPLETWSLVLSAMESGGGDFGLCVPVTDSNKTILN